MRYTLTHLTAESKYRQLYCELYCDPMKPIFTHDVLWVRFFPDQFDHAFFESRSNIRADKSVFSLERARRITWIKDTLEDPEAILKRGWDKNKKTYDNSHRVAVIKIDYVVIIHVFGKDRAKFVTAYKADRSIGKILAGPDWAPL